MTNINLSIEASKRIYRDASSFEDHLRLLRRRNPRDPDALMDDAALKDELE
jgi:hypothetical protein